VPALIGAFVGAPVLARELETGTFRYAWTQGFERWRWALAKLVALAIAATLAAYTGIALITAALLRKHYLTPLTARLLNPPGSVWIISQWWTKGGKFAFAGNWPPQVVQHNDCPPGTFGSGEPSLGALMHCFAQHGYTRLTCGCRALCCGVHGHIADGVRAVRTVGVTVGFPRTGTDGPRWWRVPA
jgi:hypothetical protein